MHIERQPIMASAKAQSEISINEQRNISIDGILLVIFDEQRGIAMPCCHGLLSALKTLILPRAVDVSPTRTF